jgi:hypothetical protein
MRAMFIPPQMKAGLARKGAGGILMLPTYVLRMPDG